MDYSKKQNELDVQKWVDSEIKNYDTCGEYSYCSNCNKSDVYPCAYAYEKYTNLVKAVNTITTNKAKKSTTIKTTTSKTSTKKSTCAKKTSPKKTSTTKKITSKI